MDQKESLKRRRGSILREAESRGYDAVVFLNEVIGQNPSNFVYVCPMGLGDEHQSLVLDVNGDATLVMPHWGAPRVEASGEYGRVIAVKQEKGHHIRGTKEALEGVNPEKVCFDLSTISAQFAYKLGEGLGVSINPERDISDHVFKLRSIKDEFEIEEMKRAIKITEDALAPIIQETAPGKSTWELKKRLDARMIELGAVEFSFESSLRFMNGKPRGTIKHGDGLLIDVGCRVDTGYCSDMGRNWPVTLTPEIRDYMERANQAQEEGIKNIREGVTGNRVLEMANEINEELGFNPAVRTGHQIGIDVHDYTMPFAPSFGPIETDSKPLKAGMTLTYEPTRRDPKLGLRGHIEDIILVTKGDPICLNQMPYDFTW